LNIFCVFVEFVGILGFKFNLLWGCHDIHMTSTGMIRGDKFSWCRCSHDTLEFKQIQKIKNGSRLK
ncbi:MAG: hypothetical protein ACTSRA_12495, partial [Promethearchaeota archaeon]